MKNIHLFSGVVIMLLFVSCSPKVVTVLAKTYPEVVLPDSVIVIEMGETVPNSAEAIGRVSVVDRGFSTQCKYDQVVYLAKEATGKAGGNGLVITNHMEPSFWGSSCHQISGLMLHLSNLEVDTLKANPVQDFLTVTNEERRKRMAPANTFEMSVGYGWITSRLYDYSGNSLGHKGGVEWRLGYEHVWKSGLGVGFQYSGYRAAFDEGNMVLSYLAPELVGRTKLNKWILKYGVGFGLLLYHEPNNDMTGFGGHLTIGVEYMLSKNIGLGATTSYVSGSLPNEDDMNLKENERSGINRFNLLGGLRFYF